MNTAKTHNDLFTPINAGALHLNNRIVMAPLTRNRADKEMVPTEMMVDYYRQRASAGLIITEATLVSAAGIGYPYTPGIFNKEQVESWKKVTAAVHQAGGKIVVQLWHCGRVSHSSMLPDGMLPRAPSAIRPDGEVFTYDGMKPYETPQAMTLAEIKQLIADFKEAAYNALSAGFDGVEVHGANGYLLDQFLRDGTNQRDDEYGGSLQNRAKLLFEVIDEVSQIWGADRVGVRLSPVQPFNDIRDSNPERTFTYVVDKLNQLNLSYLHVTEMGKDAPGAAGPDFNFASLKSLWSGVYMTNSEYSFATAQQAIENGQADLISFGKLFIANPDLVARFAQQSALNTPDVGTFYGGDERGYTDYPFLPQTVAS